MRKGNISPLEIKWGNFSDGTNLVDDDLFISNNMVRQSLNAILRNNGAQRRPGSKALTEQPWTAKLNGLHNYITANGTENLLTMSDSKLYEVATDGSRTERYDTGEDAHDAEFVDYLGTCWITDTKKVIKVENNTAYQVTIDPPSGASAVAVAGGSLPDGVYQVYAGYARVVDDVNVLYSQGEYLGEITLGTGSNTVRVTLADSTDPQVGNKIVWMTDANGSLTYLYWETDDNTTSPINVIDDSKKVASITYANNAVKNEPIGGDVIPVFEHIHAFKNRIWGSKDNVCYYSLQNSVNKYASEKFYAEHTRVIPFQITGIFDAGGHLFFNTPKGIVMQPNGNPNAEYQHFEKRWFFHDMNTVVDFSSGKLGLTNNGLKIFDAERGRFTDYDISKKIYPEIDKIYAYDTWRPIATIYRSDLRTEYHLSYCDESISSHSNNKRMVLNLDTIEFYPEKRVRAPFEFWDNGANWFATRKNESLYQAQSHATASKIYREDPLNTIDNGIWLQDGTLGGALSYNKMEVTTRSVEVKCTTKAQWHTLCSTIKVGDNTVIDVYYSDGYESLFSHNTIGEGSSQLWDAMKWDEGVWGSENAVPTKTKLPMVVKGKIVYIKFSQTANDVDFNIKNLTLIGNLFNTRRN